MEFQITLTRHPLSISGRNNVYVHHPSKIFKKKMCTKMVGANLQCVNNRFVCLFDLILYVPSRIFQLYRDRSFCVEQVLSYDKCVLLKDHNAVTPVRLEPTALRS